MAGSDAPRGHGYGEAGGLQFVAGTKFAGYRIEALLGRGGMGVVYRCCAVVRPELVPVAAR